MLLGVNFSVPFLLETLTTCTLTWPDGAGVDADIMALLADIGVDMDMALLESPLP